MRDKRVSILASPQDFFRGMVQEAVASRKMSTSPSSQEYLVSILENYIHTNNLFDTQSENGKLTRETLAEMFLKAQNANFNVRLELLKKLGDVSLYVSGIFGDSFNRKIIDVDYYIEMGEVAYGTLSVQAKEESAKLIYRDFSKRFLEFVDVLTVISQKTFTQNDEGILRLYDKYLKTGSELAREALEEKGIVTVLFDKDKKSFAQ